MLAVPVMSWTTSSLSPPAATAVIAVPCLWFADEIFTWFSEPLRAQLPAGARLIATSVVAPFMTPFKLALLAALYFAMPVVLYQVWAFVAPGLYRHERRFALPLFVSSVILFYAGSVFAFYVVFPAIFRFFVATTPTGVEMLTDMTQYMDFAVLLTVKTMHFHYSQRSWIAL